MVVGKKRNKEKTVVFTQCRSVIHLCVCVSVRLSVCMKILSMQQTAHNKQHMSVTAQITQQTSRVVEKSIRHESC